MSFDPTTVDRPSNDQGIREVVSRLEGLENRINELTATIGGEGAVYNRSLFHVKGHAKFDGTLEIAEGLIGDKALKSQISVDAGNSSNLNWSPVTGWSTGVSTFVVAPTWATRALVIAGGSIMPNYNANSGTPACWGRIECRGQYSPDFLSFLGSSAIPANISWPFFTVPDPREGGIEVNCQARLYSGSSNSGGQCFVSAVVLWLR